MAYIKSPDKQNEKKQDRGTHSGCFLCEYAQSENDAENFVVLRNRYAFVALNRFPYNNGHLLVSPLEHKSDLAQLTDQEHLSCMQLLSRMTEVIQSTMNCDGFNIGLNQGKAGGAGLPGHLHWHLVPRWEGDQNFMPVVAGTHVIPQSLQALYELLVQKISD